MTESITVWKKAGFEIIKEGDIYVLNTLDMRIEIYKDEPDDDCFISDTLHYISIPKYVKNALKKHVGEII